MKPRIAYFRTVENKIYIVALHDVITKVLWEIIKAHIACNELNLKNKQCYKNCQFGYIYKVYSSLIHYASMNRKHNFCNCDKCCSEFHAETAYNACCLHATMLLLHINPFTDEQLNLLGTMPKQFCHPSSLYLLCLGCKTIGDQLTC